jgi:two-component system sensor histidine kinase TctE
MLSAAPEDRVFYRVFGPDASTVTGYDDLPRWQPPRQRGRRVAFETPRFFDASYRGELVRFALLGREVAEPNVKGWVWVQVGQTRRARDALARELVLGALVPIALMTLLALALVTFGISRALRPLQRVGQDLSLRRPEDLQPVVEPVPREMVPLIDAINGFMRQTLPRTTIQKSCAAVWLRSNAMRRGFRACSTSC